MAKKARKSKAKRGTPQQWSKDQLKALKAHSKAMTPLVELEKLFKRTGGALRQKAFSLGLSLGHRKRSIKR